MTRSIPGRSRRPARCAARTQAAVRIRLLQDELHLRNVQLANTNLALAESLKTEERLNHKMMLEMEVAVRLQKGMLSPARLELGRIQACARYHPSAQIGGDFYDLRSDLFAVLLIKSDTTNVV
jgi:serine phosphatase RsbU (regulator of sigma subunit)